jgi:hypothetical protein
MSADNWAQCPRCTTNARAALEQREMKVHEAYGTVSVEEFDRLRWSMQEEHGAFEKREATFREDYEIYGAEDGVVTVRYSGACTECGLTLKFKDEHPIPD